MLCTYRHIFNLGNCGSNIEIPCDEHRAKQKCCLEMSTQAGWVKVKWWRAQTRSQDEVQWMMGAKYDRARTHRECVALCEKRVGVTLQHVTEHNASTCTQRGRTGEYDLKNSAQLNQRNWWIVGYNINKVWNSDLEILETLCSHQCSVFPEYCAEPKKKERNTQKNCFNRGHERSIWAWKFSMLFFSCYSIYI